MLESHADHAGLRRFKPYPAYKDSGVEWLGEIPAHWDLLPIKRVASIRYGLGEPPRELVDGLPFIRATNVARGRIDDRDLKMVDPEDVPWARNPTLRTDDIIVVRSGAYTGDSAIIPAKYDGAVAGYDMVIRARGAAPSFLAWALLSKYMLHAQIELETTRAAQPHLNAEELGSVVAILPPHSEQRAITAFLDRETARIDALVAKKERLIELLQEKRTALITRAVTKGLPSTGSGQAEPNIPMKDSGVEWLGEIPAHWEVKRIKNLSMFVTSGSRGWAEHYTDEGALFLRIGNLRTASIDLDLSDVQHVTPPPGAEGERTRVRAGDLLISITALIGAVGVVPEGTPAAFVNQHLALVRLSSSKVLPRWLGYCVLSRVGQEQLHADLYGGTKDGLSLDDIRSLVVLVPPTIEQERVIDILDSAGRHVDTLITKVRDAIDHLKELRSALISAAVTGKIDVRSTGHSGESRNPGQGKTGPRLSPG